MLCTAKAAHLFPGLMRLGKHPGEEGSVLPRAWSPGNRSSSILPLPGSGIRVHLCLLCRDLEKGEILADGSLCKGDLQRPHTEHTLRCSYSKGLFRLKHEAGREGLRDARRVTGKRGCWGGQPGHHVSRPRAMRGSPRLQEGPDSGPVCLEQTQSLC